MAGVDVLAVDARQPALWCDPLELRLPGAAASRSRGAGRSPSAPTPAPRRRVRVEVELPPSRSRVPRPTANTPIPSAPAARNRRLTKERFGRRSERRRGRGSDSGAAARTGRPRGRQAGTASHGLDLAPGTLADSLPRFAPLFAPLAAARELFGGLGAEAPAYLVCDRYAAYARLAREQPERFVPALCWAR